MKSTLAFTHENGHVNHKSYFTLRKPWCELILGLDKENKYVYYLSMSKRLD